MIVSHCGAPLTNLHQDMLKNIFSLYVEYVVKNPLHTPGETVTCLSFVNEVGECLKRHAQYA